MPEFETLLPIEFAPHTGAWRCLTKSKTVIQESEKSYWPDVDKDDIAEMVVLGIRLPVGKNYTFTREALASPGEQPNITAIICSVECDGVVMKFKFFVVPKNSEQQMRHPKNIRKNAGAN